MTPQESADNRITASWHLFNDDQAVAEAACTCIEQAASAAIRRRNRFNLVLAGGSTPTRCYRLLSEHSNDWSRWHLYFGDERCLAAGDPQRNSSIAAETLYHRVPIPAHQIHPIPVEMGAEAAARSYAVIVGKVLPFDLVLLGLGEDGHTASLFPGHHHPEGSLVVPVRSAPKPPRERVSLSTAALSSCRRVLFLVTGEEKRDAVSRWRRREPLPAAGIGALENITVFVDRVAWSAISWK
ncbi:MAG: 6-phosphogluconolactonase [Gammaproteobacteria bacterium]|nr:6-phosphogluconolactonase [Gammaproteobacteria bacterium]